MRTCEGCGTKMPAWKPRQRAEDGSLLCEGCANGRPGRPVGHHGSLHCDNCGTPMGEAGLTVTAGRLSCPDGCKTAASDPGKCTYCGQVFDTEDVAGKQRPCPARDGQSHSFGKAASLGAENKMFIEDLGQKVGMDLTDDEGNYAKVLLKAADAIDAGHALISTANKLLYVNRKAAGLTVVAHDSGDGATIFHCPFCGAGQVTARSDGTVECGFCSTYFTVQVQPQHSAQPQTINGQPVKIPGMPGDPTHQQSAQQPQTQQHPTDPNFAPAGAGGDEGFAPAGSHGAQFAPAGSGGQVPPQRAAASRKTAWSRDDQDEPDVHPDDEVCTTCDGKGKVDVATSDERQCPWCAGSGKENGRRSAAKTAAEDEAADKACEHYEESAEIPKTCKNCWWAYGAHSAKAGGPSGVGAMPTTALYLTPDGVAIPESSFLAHLALRFADDRDAVLTAVRSERTVR